MKIEITKTCNRCGILQPISEFQKHEAYTGGHVCICKKCTSDYGRKRREDPKIKERLYANNKIWKLRNPKRALNIKLRSYIKILQKNGYKVIKINS